MTNIRTPTRTSIGVFIQNKNHQWLLGHTTGQKHWDIFKGMPDLDEMPYQTALRELQEETGIILPRGALQDTGLQLYRPGKQLHVFKASIEIEPNKMVCTSFFEQPKTHKNTPEMDAFFWFSAEEAKNKAVPRLWAILDTLSSSVAHEPLLPCNVTSQ